MFCLSRGRSGFAPRTGRIIKCKNLALYIRDCVSLCLSDDTLKAADSLLSGAYVRGSKTSHQSALEICIYSWTPHIRVFGEHNCCICVSNLKGCLDKQHVRVIRCLTELLIDSAMQRVNEHDDKSLFVGSVG